MTLFFPSFPLPLWEPPLHRNVRASCHAPRQAPLPQFLFFRTPCLFQPHRAIGGELGAVLHLILKQYFLAEIASLACGSAMIGWGLMKLFHLQTKPPTSNGRSLKSPSPLGDRFNIERSGWSTFLFGFFTVALPCGQTLVVFSACALAGSGWIGFCNGFTLPS